MTESLLPNWGAYSFGWRDALDILLMTVLIYQVGLLLKGTRALQTLVGVLVVVFAYWATGPDKPLRLLTVHRILGHILFYAPFAIIILFQSPIRRALARLGRTSLLRMVDPGWTQKMVDEIASAAATLSQRFTGALIVIERHQALKDQVESGIAIDAAVSHDLLLSLFTPGSPLHDGAVIIGEGRAKAASCFLTVTTDPRLSRKYGSRHRAAIGLTEEYDSVAVAVSEERGEIRAAVGGRLTDVLDEQALRIFLQDQLQMVAPRNSASRTEHREGARDSGGSSASPGAAGDRQV